jgi:hypothetical protein
MNSIFKKTGKIPFFLIPGSITFISEKSTNPVDYTIYPLRRNSGPIPGGIWTRYFCLFEYNLNTVFDFSFNWGKERITSLFL